MILLSKQQALRIRTLASVGEAAEDISRKTGIELRIVIEKIEEYGYKVRHRKRIEYKKPQILPCPPPAQSQEKLPELASVELRNIFFLRSRGWSYKQVSERMGIPVKIIKQVCNGIYKVKE